MAGILIALRIIGLVCAVILLIYYWLHRPVPCDTCKYLLRKGGKDIFRHECQIVGGFDRQPEYCAQWCQRDNQTHN